MDTHRQAESEHQTGTGKRRDSKHIASRQGRATFGAEGEVLFLQIEPIDYSVFIEPHFFTPAARSIALSIRGYVPHRQ